VSANARGGSTNRDMLVGKLRFPTAGHLIPWAGLCPKNDESPTGQARGLKAHGKRRSTRMRKGAPWLFALSRGKRTRPLSIGVVAGDLRR
jgi:hypothetical protein